MPLRVTRVLNPPNRIGALQRQQPLPLYPPPSFGVFRSVQAADLVATRLDTILIQSIK